MKSQGSLAPGHKRKAAKVTVLSVLSVLTVLVPSRQLNTVEQLTTLINAEVALTIALR